MALSPPPKQGMELGVVPSANLRIQLHILQRRGTLSLFAEILTVAFYITVAIDFSYLILLVVLSSLQ
jgi:hypothetical protein